MTLQAIPTSIPIRDFEGELARVVAIILDFGELENRIAGVVIAREGSTLELDENEGYKIRSTE